LRALSPHYAIEFFLHAKWSAFFALGSVMLAITGAEALYADMGHFGKKPIRWSWFGFVLPALVLNISGRARCSSPIRGRGRTRSTMVPQSMLVPMLLLATAAAVIASQAVISGAFSVTREAIQLGFLPRMQVRTPRTSRSARSTCRGSTACS
jgi:KUP system potassium uptake protein